MHGGMDFAAAGLLDDLEGPEREARRALLRRLLDEGATLAELRQAIDEDRLALLPVERLLGGRHTAQEIAEQTGVPVALMLRFRRLLGLPQASDQDRVFSDEDLAAARSLALFVDAGIDVEDLAELTRVTGEGMSRLAAAITAVFARTFLRPGDSEADVAERFAGLAEQLAPALAPVLTGAFNAHLRESVHRGMIGRAERASGQIVETPELGVCFADLVGFTRLGGELEVQELGAVAGRLAGLAAERAQPPVRLVKTIGDAVMLASPDPAALVSAALGLVEDAEAAELPSLRAGIALGPAVQRAGDLFGHTVNLASRVTGVARPGSVLCTQAVREAAAGDRAGQPDPEALDFSYAGRFRLKGIADPVPLHRARRTATW
jgi:adenylate cyclase